MLPQTALPRQSTLIIANEGKGAFLLTAWCVQSCVLSCPLSVQSHIHELPVEPDEYEVPGTQDCLTVGVYSTFW